MMRITFATIQPPITNGSVTEKAASVVDGAGQVRVASGPSAQLVCRHVPTRRSPERSKTEKCGVISEASGRPQRLPWHPRHLARNALNDAVAWCESHAVHRHGYLSV